MNLFLKLSTLSLMTLALSCNSTKSVTEDNKTNITSSNSESLEQAKAMNSKMETEGYSKGTIMYLKDSECSYIILDEKSGVKFDPVNFDSKQYNTFKEDKAIIYYKYRPLRRANRCDGIQVIEIEDIKKREG